LGGTKEARSSPSSVSRASHIASSLSVLGRPGRLLAWDALTSWTASPHASSTKNQIRQQSEVASRVTTSMPSRASWRPSAPIVPIRAFTVQTALCRAPGRDGCGRRVHTIPVSFATSTAATRSWTRSCSSSLITCGLALLTAVTSHA
jgi:hypothetical protein